MKTIEIYLRDLSEEKQKEIIEAYGIEKAEDANWDIFPITCIDIEEHILCPMCGATVNEDDIMENTEGEKYCSVCEPDMIGPF